jgi:DNA-binding MarR family transcriptional regulator
MKSDTSSPSVEDAAATGLVLDYDELDRVLGFHIRQAQASMHRRIVEVLSAVDLTQKQSAALWLIGANPGTSQIGVGSALRVDRATTMAMIDRLEGRGLVLRRRSAIDRRRHELYLTPEGETVLAQVKALVHAHEQSFGSRYTPEELKTLTSLLRRIYAE